MLANRSRNVAFDSRTRRSRPTPLSSRCLASVALVALFFSTFASAATTTTGTLPDGTPYRIDFPEQFNGTLLVGLDYASGNPSSPQTRALLERGYAMAGTTRTVTGWDLVAAIENHVTVVAAFEAKHGEPAHKVVLGAS